jgi:flagellar biosynthesis/type III secretory pathway protein FliH
MVKQIFTREHFTHKKGLMFAPLVHTDTGGVAVQETDVERANPKNEHPDADKTDEQEGHAVEVETDTRTRDEIHAQAFAEGLAQGLEQGQQMARQAEVITEQEKLAAQSAAQTMTVLEEIEKQVASLVEDPSQLQEPLKRLALHLAEQLVLGELSLSPQSIERLIDRCLDTLDVPDSSALVVELNPNDLALLQNQPRPEGQTQPAWRLQSDSLLLPGSVRVRADDAVVSDLIENRLESLAQSLLNDNQQWQPQSAFSPSRLASRLASQRGSARTIEDAPSRPHEAKSEALSDLQNFNASETVPVIDMDLDEAQDAEKHTYEAHEVINPPLASPQPMPQNFADALTEISLDLDKLDG